MYTRRRLHFSITLYLGILFASILCYIYFHLYITPRTTYSPRFVKSFAKYLDQSSFVIDNKGNVICCNTFSPCATSFDAKGQTNWVYRQTGSLTFNSCAVTDIGDVLLSNLLFDPQVLSLSDKGALLWSYTDDRFTKQNLKNNMVIQSVSFCADRNIIYTVYSGDSTSVVVLSKDGHKIKQVDLPVKEPLFVIPNTVKYAHDFIVLPDSMGSILLVNKDNLKYNTFIVCTEPLSLDTFKLKQ